MGKWAMYKHRGGVRVPTPPEFPLAPPTIEQWSYVVDLFNTLQARAGNLGGGPGFFNMQFRGATINPPDPPASEISLIDGDEGTFTALFAPASYFAQARFVDSIVTNNPLSDWSSVKVVDLG